MVERPVLLNLPECWRTPRITLRPYRAGDGPELFAAVQESWAHLEPWMPWIGNHATVEDSEEIARRSQAKWLTREDLTVGIWNPEETRLLGSSGLHRMDWEAGTFEVGYWVRVSEEGKGYVSEAVRRLCQAAFEELDASEVFLRCAPNNDKSVAVAERCGFVPSEGETAQCTGSDEPALRFTMPRETWLQQGVRF